MARPVVRTATLRFDPFRDLAVLDRQFDQLARAFLAPSAARPGRAWTPLADVRATDQAYVVRVEAPGLTGDDITVELGEGEITIVGEYRSEQAAKTVEPTDEPTVDEQAEPTAPLGRGLRTGRFEYRRTLPTDADRDGVGATIADGVLTVTLPRVRRPAARRVEITQG